MRIRDFFYVTFALLVVCGFAFTMGNIDLVFSKYFGVRHENIKREVFEQSKSHVHGTIKNLSRLRMEYKLSDDVAHRSALREMILTESASFDLDKLPYDLRTFIRSL